MLAICETADDVRLLAARQAQWRRKMYMQPKKPKPIVLQTLSSNRSGVLVCSEFSAWVIDTTMRGYRTVANTISRVMDVVCAEFHITREDLLSPRRTDSVVRPRQIAMYLCPKKYSLPEIGRRFGGRDHTTVLHAQRKIKDLRQEHADLDELLTRLHAEVAA